MGKISSLKELFALAIDYWRPPKPPTDSQYFLWEEELNAYELQDVIAAYEDMKKHQQYFPNTQMWVAITDSMQHNRRKRDAEDEAKKKRNTFEPSTPECVQAARLMQALANGHITKDEYLCRVSDLGPEYAKEMSKLRHHYQQHDIRIDTPARPHCGAAIREVAQAYLERR